MIRLISLLLFICALAACGQKGPLVAPDRAPSSAPTAPVKK